MITKKPRNNVKLFSERVDVSASHKIMLTHLGMAILTFTLQFTYAITLISTNTDTYPYTKLKICFTS